VQLLRAQGDPGWAAAGPAGGESRADPTSAPPPWPAEEFATIPVQLSDDVSTRYSLCSGEHGGDGTEFLVRWRFRPTPPSTATRLTLSFVPPYGPSVRLDLYLDA
jgi:hypothetical protein